MGLRESFRAGLAKQLGHPSGLRGKLVGRMLNRRNGPHVTKAVEALGLRAGETAADFGFGGGFGLGLLLTGVATTGVVHGVDISTTMVDQAKNHYRADPRVHIQLGSLTDIPLGAAELDAAITLNTFYFIEELDQAIGELARVLKPGGRLVVGLLDPDAMRTRGFTDHGFRARPVDKVVAALATAGFALAEQLRVGTGDSPYHLLVLTRQGS